jgi:hypothetical protein
MPAASILSNSPFTAASLEGSRRQNLAVVGLPFVSL